MGCPKKHASDVWVSLVPSPAHHNGYDGGLLGGHFEGHLRRRAERPHCSHRAPAQHSAGQKRWGSSSNINNSSSCSTNNSRSAPIFAHSSRGIDFLKMPKTRGRRLARVGRGPAAPTEWRARVARVGGARGGPYGQVHIARRPPWRRLRLTVWGGAGRSNQIARNGPKRAAGAQRAEVGIAFGPMLQ